MKTSLDPRVKLVAFAAVTVVAATSGFPRLGGLAFLCLVVQVISRISAIVLLKRLLPAIPLLGFLAIVIFVAGRNGNSTQGAVQSGLLGARTLVVLWALVLLSSTTPFSDIARALAGLGFPHLVTDILFFAGRYESLLAREAEKLHRALAARSAANRRILKKPGMLVRLMSRPLEKAFDRSVRIHAAMLARGWRGKLPISPCGKLTFADSLFVVSLGAWLIAVLGLLE